MAIMIRGIAGGPARDSDAGGDSMIMIGGETGLETPWTRIAMTAQIVREVVPVKLVEARGPTVGARQDSAFIGGLRL
jgi:hypothetical protein